MDNKVSPFWIGTSGWTYEHWKGVFYPENLPRNHWFEYYWERFSTVEINATFYHGFKDQTYRNWYARTPPGFRFVLKAPRWITHRKFLQDVSQDIQKFYTSASLLQEKLGMILLQIAPNTPYDLERLRNALLAFDDPHKVAIEFRRAEWLNEATFDLLKSLGATFCSADAPGSHLSETLTSKTAYLRLHGRTHWYSHDYSEAELNEVADLARRLGEQGAQRVYIFFNNDFEAHAPYNALALRNILGD